MSQQEQIEQLQAAMQEVTSPMRIMRGSEASHMVLALLAVMGISPAEQIGVLAFCLGAFIHQQQVSAAAGQECLELAEQLLRSAYDCCQRSEHEEPEA